MFKKYRISCVMLIIICIISLGCAHANSGKLDEKQLEEIVDLARNIILAQYSDLDNESKLLIREEFPYYKYYLLSGNYAQYSFDWKISAGRFIRLYGVGNIMKLENSKCEMYSSKEER